MTTALKFRNIDASRTTRWRLGPSKASSRQLNGVPCRTGAAAQPRSGPIPGVPVAQQVLEAIRLSHPYGTAELLLEGVVARARELGYRFRT